MAVSESLVALLQEHPSATFCFSGYRRFLHETGEVVQEHDPIALEGVDDVTAGEPAADVIARLCADARARLATPPPAS